MCLLLLLSLSYLFPRNCNKEYRMMVQDETHNLNCTLRWHRNQYVYITLFSEVTKKKGHQHGLTQVFKDIQALVTMDNFAIDLDKILDELEDREGEIFLFDVQRY